MTQPCDFFRKLDVFELKSYDFQVLVGMRLAESPRRVLGHKLSISSSLLLLVKHFPFEKWTSDERQLDVVKVQFRALWGRPSHEKSGSKFSVSVNVVFARGQ